MGYVDKGDRLANSYSISWRTFKWMKKLFFHLLDLVILNKHILHSLCGGKKISHRYFWCTLVRNMLVHAGPEQRVPRPLGRPPNVESHLTRLKVCGSKRWPTRSWGVACVGPGVWPKKSSWSAISVTWDCVCETNMFRRLPHQGTIVRRPDATSLKNIWASRRYVSKGNWKFSIFRIIIMYNYKLKILTGFLNTHTNISVLFPKKMPFSSLFNLVWFP